jgi:hypothetical protein
MRIRLNELRSIIREVVSSYYVPNTTLPDGNSKAAFTARGYPMPLSQIEKDLDRLMLKGDGDQYRFEFKGDPIVVSVPKTSKYDPETTGGVMKLTSKSGTFKGYFDAGFEITDYLLANQ